MGAGSIFCIFDTVRPDSGVSMTGWGGGRGSVG